MRPARPGFPALRLVGDAPQLTLVDLMRTKGTVGARIGLFVAWQMMGQPIPLMPTQRREVGRA
ncbi:MAG: hypothetical protein NVS3B10_00310 [Polyangiales bacterium]